MEVIEAIDTRSSPRKIGEPGPSAADVRRMLRSAARAPDHGRIAPWRFTVLEGEGRDRLGVAMAESFREKYPLADAEQIETERAKPRRAPVVIAVAARAVQGHKVPEIEQLVATAAAVQNMLLTAHALGFGAMWKTGGAAYDARVKRALGFESEDRIVGFLYVGSVLAPNPPRVPMLEDRVTWHSS